MSNDTLQESGPSQQPLTDRHSPKSKGQKSSKERGSATNHKKSAGKRPKQGGSSA